jgi:hypothetical protein
LRLRRVKAYGKRRGEIRDNARSAINRQPTTRVAQFTPTREAQSTDNRQRAKRN